MPSTTMPTFLVIGAAKAGTTALYTFLDQHPQIFMSRVKEPHFFAYEGSALDVSGPGDRRSMHHMVTTQLDDYRSLFAGRSERARGEASAMYLYIEGTAPRIRRYLPDAKLVAVLRHPVDRAYSSYLHLIRDGREDLPFADALAAEPERIRSGYIPLWHYRAMGHYTDQLERYLACFPASQLQIHLYDDLRDRPAEVVGQIFEFVGVDPSFTPDLSLQRNVSGRARNATWQRILSQPHPLKDRLKPLLPNGLRERTMGWLRNRNVAPAEPLDPDLRSALNAHYAPEIDRLERLLGRDLAIWRQ